MDSRPTRIRRRPFLYSSGGLLLALAITGVSLFAFSRDVADPARVGLALRVGTDSLVVDSLRLVDPDDLGAVDAALVAAARLEGEPAVWLGQERVALHPDVVPFYRSRDLRLVWTDPASRDTLVHALRLADHDALDASAFRTGAMTSIARAIDARDPRQDLPVADTVRADLDLALTDALLRYAEQLRGSRTDPVALYGAMAQDARSPRDVLAELDRALVHADSLGAWLGTLAPPHDGYRHLRAALVRQLDGTGPDTLSADLLRLNMERWRWLPRELGTRHVMVNVPSYHLWIRDGGRDVFDMPVVVGQPGRWQTPAFTDTMETIVFSPEWIMPASIQRESYGYVRPGRTQAPGPRNPMGRAKFLFPNDQAIYIHDTNSKWGFSRTYRALSHGCVRASEPEAFAAALLTRTNGWSTDDVAERFSGRWVPETVSVDVTLPVHLVYFTAWAEPDGTVRQPADVYARDARLATALGLSL